MLRATEKRTRNAARKSAGTSNEGEKQRLHFFRIFTRRGQRPYFSTDDDDSHEDAVCPCCNRSSSRI